MLAWSWRALRPVDRLLIGYNASFAGLWVVALGRFPFAPWLALAHVTALLLSVLSAGVRPHASRFGVGAADLYPVALIAIYWLEMGLVRDVFHQHGFDRFIAAADLWPFGVHLHSIWIPNMPWVWFSEVMNALYWLYYPLVFFTPFVLFAIRRDDDTVRLVFRVALAYLACYVSYAIFPVDGPSHTMQKFQGPHTQAPIYRLVSSGTHAGDSMGTAFPSSHVVGAVTVALFALARFSVVWRVVFVIGALGVVLSTVYRQSHFAIDSAAGVVAGVLLYYLVAPRLERVLAGSTARESKDRERTRS